MPGPLDGLRIVDCSTGTAGTRATGLLADYGADVIWVEPVGGDPLREQLAVEYAVYNRGKRSVVCDLATDEGRAQLYALLATADVFLSSWRPGVAERLGVGFTQLNAEFPHLVVCEISGFGADSPHREIPGYESVVFGVVGVTGEQVGSREGPIYEGLPFATIGAAYLAQLGILAALHRRQQDGHGRLVETSLVDGALSFLGMTWGDSDNASLTPQVRPGTIRLVSRSFACSDEEYLGIHTGALGAFGRLIRVLGLDDDIPVADDGTDMRIPLTAEQSVIVRERIPEIMATRTRDEWLRLLVDADVCAIPALRPGEVLDDEQTRHNGMVITVDDPGLGLLEQVAPPAKMLTTPASVRGPAPAAGEHSAEVFAQLAACDPRPVPTGPVDDRPLLHDIHVLDLGAYYAGPFSSRLLADLGADVIKLETTVGDQLRGIARPFRSAQAGKRGISVNLKDAELRPALEGLLGWADIVSHNMRPGAAQRLGMDVGSVHAVNPQAIYLYAPGWGSSGPKSTRQSFAPMLSGFVGASHEVAGQFNDPLFPLGNEDPGNGLLGAVASLMALYARDRGARGQYIENSQLNATLAHMAHIVRTSDGQVLNAMRLDPLQMGIAATDRLYETADGWIMFAVSGARTVPVLSRVLGRDIAHEVDYADPQSRRENDFPLTGELADAFATRPTADWLVDLAALGAGVIHPLADNNCTPFHRDPENHRTGRIAEVDHPVQGVVREIAQLVRVSSAAVRPHTLAPELGEHTDKVLAEFGYTADTLAELRARGSIR